MVVMPATICLIVALPDAADAGDVDALRHVTC